MKKQELSFPELNHYTQLVFTNGVFDIIHPGHLKLLKECKKILKGMNASLIVAINSDASTKRLKGSSRPINTEEVRKKNLEDTGLVDEVIIFNEDTPYELIKKLQPYCIVKGGDYKPDDVVGKDIAPVYIVPTLKGHSTTNIIDNRGSGFYDRHY